MMDCTMYVLADKQYTKVKEPGYQTIEIETGKEEKMVVQEILEKILQSCSSSTIGICMYDLYFIEHGRLLSMEGSVQKLEESDLVLPSRALSTNLGRLGSLMMLATKEVVQSYYDQVILPEKEMYISILEWAKKSGRKVTTTQVEAVDTERMPDMIACIEELTRDLQKRYQSGYYLRLPKIKKDVGDGNRMPIWICWWQGIEQAPRIVKRCIASIRDAFPESIADIRIITFDNYQEYVHLSDIIWKRYTEGAPSLTHLSDVLRAQLLCRYGGLWIDATCFLYDARFVKQLIQYPFYTRKMGGPINELDVVSGRWATYFVKGPAGFPLFGFWVEAFEAYWEEYDTLKNYFLFDYITLAAYQNIEMVHAIMDAIPNNNAAAEVLSSWCNEPYREEKLRLLTKENWLFKMTYKKEYQQKTPQGEDTFYKVVFED